MMSVSASAPSEPLGTDRVEIKNSSDVNESAQTLPPFAWMVKPCKFYREEYNDCKSIKARFHQYFVHGETLDCNQWNEDYNNCCAWGNKEDIKALKELTESEQVRAKTRLKAHFGNDVWENRASPPSDWNSELPKDIKKEYESSFLKIKADELKSGKMTLDDEESKSSMFDISETTCSIV